jgi:stress-induced morphogen
MQEIIIDIADDGEITLETKGFKGKACLKEAQFVKDLLGHELASQLTPAYYETSKKCTKKYLKLCG